MNFTIDSSLFSPITDRLPESVKSFAYTAADHGGRAFKYFAEQAVKYPLAAAVGVNVAVYYIAETIKCLVAPIIRALTLCCISKELSQKIAKYGIIVLANVGLYALLQPTLVVALAVPLTTVAAIKAFEYLCCAKAKSKPGYEQV